MCAAGPADGTVDRCPVGSPVDRLQRLVVSPRITASMFALHSSELTHSTTNSSPHQSGCASRYSAFALSTWASSGRPVSLYTRTNQGGSDFSRGMAPSSLAKLYRMSIRRWPESCRAFGTIPRSAGFAWRAAPCLLRQRRPLLRLLRRFVWRPPVISPRRESGVRGLCSSCSDVSVSARITR